MKNDRTKTKPLLTALGYVAGLGLALTAAQQALALATLLGDPDSGDKIHDARCVACHVNMYGADGSKIYTRADHNVKSVEGLMRQVELCNTNSQNGELNSDQLDDLTAFLNETYYLFED